MYNCRRDPVVAIGDSRQPCLTPVLTSNASHQHEFVAYPELLTLSIDQLCVSILKGLSTTHSLIPYTLLVPKEFCKSEKSHLHPGNTTSYNDMMKKTEENHHGEFCLSVYLSYLMN
ncbi:unnamed protein product [Trichobilharzia regenti]|nr:unnamed protein product [Trichobilharzia regenti]